MILLIRVLPILTGLIEVFVFWQQRLHPSVYPWLVGIGVLWLPVASFLIAWKHVRFNDLLEKMAPTYLLLAALAFALLLVENIWTLRILITLAGVSSLLSLEVLFLLAHHPTAYPVNGISRVNIGYVPLIVWYAVSTSIGLITFIHSPRVWHVVLCAVLGAVLFRTTGHPGASEAQNRIWTLIGVATGVEIAVLGLLMPVSLAIQGFVAAAIFSAVLRVRRYLYDPKPSHRMAVSEGTAFLASLIFALSTARWF